jgi:formylglycine-generating enzyme required for sulfatase activity
MSYCRAITFLVIFTSCSLYAGIVFSGSINKCVTIDGRIEFTDQPCLSAAHSSPTENTMHTKGDSATKDKAARTAVNGPAMVRVPGRNYEIGKYEVTQGEWKAVMGNNPSRFSNCGDSCPVEKVSWNDAQEFIQKLNQKTGKQYRLPTEAEWEYACYGGSQSEYCGGSNLDSVGWSYKNSNNQTHPAGQKQANGYGLYDMSGNVWELTSDCWEGSCGKRVLRGSSWDLISRDKHGGIRYWIQQAVRNDDSGFRLVRTLP